MYYRNYKDYRVEIINVEDFTEGSADNKTSYDYVYLDQADKGFIPTSKHGIIVIKDGIYKSAILLAVGGATGVLPDSAIVDEDKIIVCCCNKVFSLQLPDLHLSWIREADEATCFSIYQYQDSYIIHGEMNISRLSRSGTIIWQVSGRDIFVNIDHIGSTFQMDDDCIQLMDWGGFRYKLSYDGILSDDGIASLMNA